MAGPGASGGMNTGSSTSLFIKQTLQREMLLLPRTVCRSHGSNSQSCTQWWMNISTVLFQSAVRWNSFTTVVTFKHTHIHALMVKAAMQGASCSSGAIWGSVSYSRTCSTRTSGLLIPRRSALPEPQPPLNGWPPHTPPHINWHWSDTSFIFLAPPLCAVFTANLTGGKR